MVELEVAAAGPGAEAGAGVVAATAGDGAVAGAAAVGTDDEVVAAGAGVSGVLMDEIAV